MRRPYQGMWNVVRFNWPMYAGALVCVAISLAVPHPLVRWGAIVALFYLLNSLAVSHYVYDLSDLYRWNWLTSRLSPPSEIVNIHSGFDETTEQLQQLYPNAAIATLDFYDPVRNPEPSIARARALYPSPNSLTVDSRHLPLDSQKSAMICCLLAAHELRSMDEKVAFFEEIARALQADGRLVVAEHLRDLPNLLAFGPGFIHFFARSHWHEAFRRSGLLIEDEFPINPFVRGFLLSARPS